VTKYILLYIYVNASIAFWIRVKTLLDVFKTRSHTRGGYFHPHQKATPGTTATFTDSSRYWDRAVELVIVVLPGFAANTPEKLGNA